MNLHLAEEIYIVEGKPFVIIDSIDNTTYLILGDLHLGQQGVISNSDDAVVGEHLKILVPDILDTCRDELVTDIIFNGDTKHATSTITYQEQAELDYLIEKLGDYTLHFVLGNHDPLLPEMLNSDIHVVEEIRITRSSHTIIIAHGHQKVEYSRDDILILSHEHPCYSYSGDGGIGQRLPAFIVLHPKNLKLIIILPTANDISSGVRFPPPTFMSPVLVTLQYTHMQILPFHDELGLLPLPKMQYE